MHSHKGKWKHKHKRGGLPAPLRRQGELSASPSE